jgi:rieske iron-sulfur protein
VADTKPIRNKSCSQRCGSAAIDPLRRGLLLAGVAAAAAGLLPTEGRADDEDPRRKMRPQVGDEFVRFEGDQEGAVIAAEDLHLGADPIIAWAMDPATKLPRDGSRLNQVLLLRLDPSSLGPETLEHSADGLVAYSAICTHAQCTVSAWMPDSRVLHCPCHQSEFDPRHDAKVVGGPAPRPLAALPLKIVDGKPTVAAGFIGKIGMDQPAM